MCRSFILTNFFTSLFIDSFIRGSFSKIRGSVPGSARINIILLFCLAIDWVRVEGRNIVKMDVTDIFDIGDYDII